MKTKKILSVLLAMLLMFSVGGAALAADDGYSWTPLPGSPDGLNDGDYYVDWTDFLTLMAQEADEPVDPADLAAEISAYNSGEWFFDYDAYALKGTVTIPAAISETGEDETVECPVESGDQYMRFVLQEVGAQWIPVAKSTAGISDGEWYIDLSGAKAKGSDFVTAMRNASFYVNPGSRLMEYKIVLNNEWEDTYYLPLYASSELLTDILTTCPIRQFEDNYNWAPVPTSPDGLGHGDIWFDFTWWLSDDWTEQEKTEVLNRLNAGTWYVDLAADMVKVENPAGGLNGIYSRSQQPYICCLREVDPVWFSVSKNLAGVQVGDYYIDQAAWYDYAVPAFTAYYAAQYTAEHENEVLSADQMQQLAIKCREIAEMYFNSYSYDYNPGGKIEKYRFNGMAYPYVRYLVDKFIADLMEIIGDALDVSIRQATAETVAQSPWVTVATSVDNAAEGGYYIDFDDPTVLAAMNANEPSAEEIAVIKAGAWFADFGRGVVCGKITETDGVNSFTFWTEESADLFRYVKVKPAASTEEPGAPEAPQQQRPNIFKAIAAFFLRLVAFFKKIFGAVS